MNSRNSEGIARQERSKIHMTRIRLESNSNSEMMRYRGF
jgi:hypothetical protein